MCSHSSQHIGSLAKDDSHSWPIATSTFIEIKCFKSAGNSEGFLCLPGLLFPHSIQGMGYYYQKYQTFQLKLKVRPNAHCRILHGSLGWREDFGLLCLLSLLSIENSITSQYAFRITQSCKLQPIDGELRPRSEHGLPSHSAISGGARTRIQALISNHQRFPQPQYNSCQIHNSSTLSESFKIATRDALTFFMQDRAGRGSFS